MKTVGKQLEEARLAKNWAPELAARETKIRVDRLRDLEADDYTHFTSPTYARGFVRTYARALGLDEYKILRQLDNKLPEDDNATMITDSGVSYMPESSEDNRASIGSNPAIYVVMALGSAVMLVIGFVIFQAYRAGELSSYFKQGPSTPVAVVTPVVNEADSAPKAVPVDPNAIDTSHAAKAEPVDLAPTAAAALTNAPTAIDPAAKPVAVDPTVSGTNSVTATAIAPTNAPPRALPVDPSELAALSPTSAATTPVVAPAPTPTPSAPPAISARQSNSGPVHLPPPLPAAIPTPPTIVASAQQIPPPDTATSNSTGGDRRLILTASRDSFVKVTALDGSDQVLYASVLHTGQSIGFDQHKYSVNVGVPAAVNITLDGVNYGPHSDQDAPETFTIQSHQP